MTSLVGHMFTLGSLVVPPTRAQRSQGGTVVRNRALTSRFGQDVVEDPYSQQSLPACDRDFGRYLKWQHVYKSTGLVHKPLMGLVEP